MKVVFFRILFELSQDLGHHFVGLDDSVTDIQSRRADKVALDAGDDAPAFLVSIELIFGIAPDKGLAFTKIHYGGGFLFPFGIAEDLGLLGFRVVPCYTAVGCSKVNP